MARSSTVKLSITSAFDSKGTRAAENAMKSFEKTAAAMGGSNAFASSMAAKSVAMEQFGAKLTNAGTKAVAVGTTMTKGLTVPIAAAAAVCVKSASDMESAFANVRKTVDATDEEYQRLYDSAIELSTAHPISAADVAIIQSLGAQLGISTENLGSFAETVYGMDIATDLDAETAATQLAQFANICGTAEDQLSNVGSTVVALGNTSATTEATIMGLGMRLAASGTQAGMSEANILAISAALGSLGMEAEAGGTAMSATLNQISKDVATNSSNVKIWADLTGQSIDEFAANWSAGGDTTTATFAAVIEGMARTSDEGGNLTVLLEELGITGIRQSDAMKRLASSGDLLTGSINTANTAYAENSALTQEVANFEDTFASKLEVTKNKMTAAAITAGGPLMDALSSVLDLAEPLIKSVSNAAESFAEMDQGSQQVVIGLLATAAAIGPVTIGVGKLLQAGGSIASTAGKVTAKLAAWSATSTATAAATTTTTVASKAATAATVAQTTATRTMASVSTAAKVAVAGLAIAGIVALGMAIAEVVKREQNYTQATQGLIDATRISTDVNYASTASMSELGGAASLAAYNVYDLVEKQAGLAAQFAETNRTASADVTVLEEYQRTINELGGKTIETAEDQARLEVAIKGISDATGVAYSVAGDYTGQIYDQNGALIENVDAINEVIDVKQRQIQVEAHESNYRAAVEAKAEADEAHAAAIVKTENARNALAEAEKMGIANLSGLEENLCLASEEEARLKGLVDSAATAMENEAATMALVQASASGAASEIGNYLAEHTIVPQILKNTGQSFSTFQRDLENTGVSMEQLGELSDTELQAMTASYDGNIESIKTKLLEYTSYAPEQAAAAAQGVRTLTEAELNPLPGTIQEVAAGTMANYNGELYKFDGASGRWVAQLSKDAVSGVPCSFKGTANGAIGEFDGALYKYDGASGKWVAEQAKSQADSVDMRPSGENFTAGFAKGIGSAVSAATNAAISMVNQTIAAAQAAQAEASPSRVMKKSGRNFTRGYGLGIEEDAAFAVAAAENMVEDTIAAASKATASNTTSLGIDTALTYSATANKLSVNASTAANTTSSAAVIAQSTFDDSRIVNSINLIGDKLDKIQRVLEQIRDRQLVVEWNQREMARVIGLC